MKSWKNIIHVLGFAGAIGFILIIVGARHYFKTKAYAKMTPAQIRAYEAWDVVPLRFPTAALQAEPYDPDTLAAGKAFLEEWKKHSLDVMNLEEKYQKCKTLGEGAAKNAEWRAMEIALPALEPLIEAYEFLLARPDYEQGVWGASIDPIDEVDNSSSGFLSAQLMAKLLRTKSVALTRQNKHKEALETTETIIRSAKTAKYSILIAHLISVAINAIGSQAWLDAIEACDDPELLRRSLARQNELAERFPIITRDVNISVLDQVGGIRSIMKKGLKADIDNCTAKEISMEAMFLRKRYVEEILLPAVKGDVKLEEKLQARIDVEEASLDGFTMKVAVFIAGPTIYAMHSPNFQEALTRDDTTRAKFDLLRLRTARKLHAIEHPDQPSVASVEELVKAGYFPANIKDTFLATEDSYGFASGVFYSVGPDEKDDKANIPYDPTNGSTSVGDIFFDPPAKP